MKTTRSCSIAGLMLVECLLALVWAPIESSAKSPTAIEIVRTQLEGILPHEAPLEVNRLGSLKQETYSLQDFLGARRERVFRSIEFFEVFPAPYRVADDGGVELESVTLDSNPCWLVALDEYDGEWFLLRGFEQTTTIAAYNRLAQTLSLELSSEEQALDLFDYFLKIAKGADYRASIPTDALSLQAIVSGDYVERYATGERLTKFMRWWTRYKDVRKRLVPPKVEKVGDSFRLSYFRYSRDSVLSERIYFAKDGRVVPASE